MNLNNTVAAQSTPVGRGAISMIRMTGDDAIAIAAKVFKPKKKSLDEVGHAKAVYGDFFYGGEPIDDGVATVYRAPRSYTGEDMVELCCHGGVLVTGLVLKALYEAGAVPAEGGDFTKRAFINGKLRLSQAEAIMDIIDAESEAALRISGASGRGRLTDEVQSMYDSLKHLIAATYAYIDYPDEDMTDITVEQMKEELQNLLGRAYRLKESRKTSYAVCDGVRTVICGKPNVGKSSLLNLFTGKETAIVTEIPGTTRDIVKDSVMCGDVKLRLYDTAGIRDTDDTVEKIGVERAKTALSEAKLVLAVFDSSRPKDKEDEELVKELSKLTCPVIGVINKSDENRFSSDYEGLFGYEVKISAKTGEGKSELEKIIVDLFLSGGINYDLPHIANDRQYSELLRFISSAENALQTLKSGQTQDIACLDLEDALAALAELDGLEVTDDIVNEIFTKFCVGK